MDSLRATYQRLLQPVFIPSLISALAQQAAAVLLPMFFLSLGMSQGAAAATFGARGLGMMIADLPAGALIARTGDRRGMMLGLGILGLVCLGCASALWVVLLAPLMLLYGVGLSIFLLSRLTLVTANVAADRRGRVMSVLAGLQRLAALVGPLLAGVGAQYFGFGPPLLVLAGGFVLAATLIYRSPLGVDEDAARHVHDWRQMWRMVVQARAVFLTAGLCGLLLMLLRACRILAIPLYGHALGLNVAEVGVVATLSAVSDLLLFYPAGTLMDRCGRRWVLIPGTALLAGGFLLLPQADSGMGLGLVALLLGLANGFTTGVVMTIGADLAPTDGRPAFLAAWRLVADTGITLGPFLLAAGIGLLGLDRAMQVIGWFGLVGALLALRFVVETHPARA